MLMMVWMLAGTAAASECPVAVDEVNAHLLRALAAAEQQRFLDFEAERRHAEELLQCASEVLREQTLVNVHLVWTVRARLSGDREGVLAGIRGLRVVDPGFQLPESWADGNPAMDELFVEASQLGPGREALLPGRMVVDGHVASQYLPLERSAVVQVKNTSGSWTTWYVPPEELSATWLDAREAMAPGPSEASAPLPLPVE
jgi:hypothetical protein